MPFATMTSKGQITIPKEVRDDLGLKAGDKVLFAPLPGRRVALVPRNRSIRDLAAVLHDPNRMTVSIEAMNEAIAEAAAESGMRGLTP